MGRAQGHANAIAGSQFGAVFGSRRGHAGSAELTAKRPNADALAEARRLASAVRAGESAEALAAIHASIELVRDPGQLFDRPALRLLAVAVAAVAADRLRELAGQAHAQYRSVLGVAAVTVDEPALQEVSAQYTARGLWESDTWDEATAPDELPAVDTVALAEVRRSVAQQLAGQGDAVSLVTDGRCAGRLPADRWAELLGECAPGRSREQERERLYRGAERDLPF